MRAKHLGVWGSSAYRIESADNVERLGASPKAFNLSRARSPKWERAADTSTSISPMIGGATSPTASSGRAFAAAGIDLKGLAGKPVRVRGWIEWRNGPMIAATHPEQLELLPAAAPAL